jgi:hypothetical protein
LTFSKDIWGSQYYIYNNQVLDFLITIIIYQNWVFDFFITTVINSEGLMQFLISAHSKKKKTLGWTANYRILSKVCKVESTSRYPFANNVVPLIPKWITFSMDDVSYVLT